MRGCSPSQVLFDYLQRELPPDQLAGVEAHLLHCVACREELSRLQQQIQKVQEILVQLNPLQEGSVKPLQDYVPLTERPVSGIPLPRMAAALAATVMLILRAVMHLSGNQCALMNSIARVKTIADRPSNQNLIEVTRWNRPIPDELYLSGIQNTK
jgi:hypothetical protein